MATLTKVASSPKYPAVAADIVAFTPVASVVTGDDFVMTGRDVLLAWNSDGANPYTFTLTGQVDIYGRTVTITKSLTAGQMSLIPLPLMGWADGNMKMNLLSSNVAIKYAVITLPN